MYEVQMTTTFRKNTELCKKRGYDMELLKTAIHLLEISGRLPKEYRPHKLTGDYAGCWECHLKGDWLLVWKQNDQAMVLLFTGTGTHVDLFEKGKKR
jgi:mRNA interferase YafQ